MSRLERREQALHRLILLNKDKTEYHTERSGHKKRKVMVEKVKSRLTIPFTLSEALPYTPPEYHHHISLEEFSDSYTHFPKLNKSGRSCCCGQSNYANQKPTNSL